MSSFLSRVAVTLVGLPIVLAAAYWGGWGLFVLATLAALIALHEFYGLTRELRPLVLAGYAGAVGGLVGAILAEPVWMLGAVLASAALALLFVILAETRQSATVAVGTTFLGASWVGFGLGTLVLIREQAPTDTAGRQLVFTVLLTVFAADTFAYLGGHVFGRHKMTPVLSPGKTWEGFVSGAGAGIFVAWISIYGEEHLEGWRIFLLGAIVVLAAALGDLFESVVKRDLGAKDTGRILLGHGGVLDRIDSLLFAGPGAYFTLLALGEL